MNLILVDKCDEVGAGVYRLGDARGRHVRRVLRAGVGDELKVGLINGPKGTAVVRSVGLEAVELECEFAGEMDVPDVEVDLVCGLPRPQTLKKVLQSAATMGVRRVHFVDGKRVEKCYFSASVLDEVNVVGHLLEGMSQGRQTRMPMVFVHRWFRRFFWYTLENLERAEEVKAKRLLTDMAVEDYLAAMDAEGVRRVLLAVGPEGGWVQSEIDMMVDAGFEKFRLGAWPLRVENAVVAALGQLELAVRG
ncbi:16S ribosomal RNA methyltransferase RsmE [Anaerohalosphaera lusitana]|uniref:Ribosomal RNA small subunit methyltransferase E n=1 Tax=Anaerohalosphaera lusitana TaxID=1936003 RepID=A0A1U9NHV1_9BACT|nr:RsmE family RNA methyltransferase [Anaerohalosphaera lusitana]AQT67180.1 16S ribosomal RNA methyltransferase RsmE [Anaerohalosphaera lusitana]